MDARTGILIATLFVQLQFGIAALLEARQNMPRVGPFYLETRNQDVSNGTANYNYLQLTQIYNDAGNALPLAHATWQGPGSIFHLHNGVLSSNFTYLNNDSETETSVWKNTPVHGNRRISWRPESDLANPNRRGKMNIELGTHAFLSPGGSYTESDWTFCHNDDGSDYGLAIGTVSAEGVTCEPVYVFLIPKNDSA